MHRIAIHAPLDPRLADYQNLKDSTLAAERGRFIVEGRGVLEVLLENSSYSPESILLSERTARALSDYLDERAPDCPVYVAEQSVMDRVVGFPIHRGCLAACVREEAPDPSALAAALLAEEEAPRIVVLEGLRNLDNVGGIFRNARAFGARGVVLCPASCDPLYRKAIRTSMGGSLCVPFARSKDWPGPLGDLRAAGFTLLALDPAPGGGSLRKVAGTIPGPIALLVGTEGTGLTAAALDCCDLRVRIEMEPDVDSLNVAMAAGVALHALRPEAEGESDGAR